MPSYQRPGVFVEESLSVSNTPNRPATSDAVFVGPADRGPVTPTLIQSWSQFTKNYGNFGTTTGDALALAVYSFFANGGRTCYVQRVLSAAADFTPATITLNDGGATPTLKIDAKNPGTWGNSLYVEVTAGATANEFTLTVYFNGSTGSFIVERWTDLINDTTADRHVETIINDLNAGSSYITIPSGGILQASVRPADSGSGPEVLTTGSDGTAITDADFNATVAAELDVLTQGFNLACPGTTDTTALNTIITYCENRGDVFLVTSPQASQTPAQAVSYAQGLTSSSYAACYYPHVTITDPTNSSPSVVRTVPPLGAVLGQMSKTDAVRGVWKAPAGLDTRIANAVGIETKLSNANLETLNSSNVNAIRHIPGSGVVVMGARTLKSSPRSDRYIPVRRTLINIKKTLLENTEWAVFEPNDSTLWSTVRNQVAQYLMGIWSQGGLRGATPDEAFYVKCDAENNTAQTIANGEVNVEVGVALQYPAEFIVIKIGQWEGGQAASELN